MRQVVLCETLEDKPGRVRWARSIQIGVMLMLNESLEGGAKAKTRCN